MDLNRRILIVGGSFASAVALSPVALAQASKGARKLVLGQSVPLTGAADQIGLAYFNGAKMYFDAINAKNGACGYRGCQSGVGGPEASAHRCQRAVTRQQRQNCARLLGTPGCTACIMVPAAPVALL